MPRFSTYIVGITVWAFTVLLLMADTAHPALPLVGPGIVLALSLSLAAWVIFIMAEAGATPLVRLSQASFFSVPFVWALWVSNNHDFTLEPAAWLYLLTVSVLSAGVQEIALLERAEDREPISYDLLDAVRPILTPPAALDTGSMRIPRC